MENFLSKWTIFSIKIKQQALLSDSKNVSDLIAYLRLKNHWMFRTLQGVDSSISIGRIKRRHESLQTYDTNILCIWQTLINTNYIYSTNITRNLPRDFMLNWFKTLKYFWQALKYFYIMCDIAWYDNWHTVKWHSKWRPSELFVSYFQWEVECKKQTSFVF